MWSIKMVCSKCGACCKSKVFEIAVQAFSEDELTYYSYRGITFELRFEDRCRKMFMIVPCRCMHLLPDNTCAIFETRPDICNKLKRGNTRIFKFKGCTDE